MRISKIFSKLMLTAAMLMQMEARAQDVLTVNPEFKKVSEFEFNSEWHYLTSELYLFNSGQFQPMVSGLYAGLSKKAKASMPSPESILITARIGGTALGNLSCPIFNFNITGGSGQPTALASDTYEAIRIIDNLPLSAVSSGRVDCGIDIDLITSDKPNKVFDFVAAQLGHISSWTSMPMSAAKTLVGELGNLITARTSKKEYKFSSTIRLYEEDDFSKRVASVSVYSIKPTKAPAAGIDTSALAKHLASQDNPRLDRACLQRLIECSGYPYIVIVNYKSKYASDPVIGDETTSETVDARMAKVKKAYESGLISADICTQELKLVEYLYAFVDLKSHINNYLLNYKNRITSNFGWQHAQIYDSYLSLREMMSARKTEFTVSPIFSNEFLPTYTSILTNADSYLDADNSLRNIKNIARLMAPDRQAAKPSALDAAQIEQRLSVLHSIEFPSEASSHRIDDLAMAIQKLEKDLLSSEFEKKISRLASMQPSPEATAFCESLKNETNSTYCRSCRESANNAISDYMQRLDAENLRAAQQRLQSAEANARDAIFSILQKEKILKKHFAEDFGDTLPDDVEYIHEDFVKLQDSREKLQQSIRKDYSGQNTTQLNLISDNIEYESQNLAKILDNICKKMPELCE